MPFQRCSLAAFLSAARAALNRGIQDRSSLNLVIGNESADLDSITSSITFAYLKSLGSKARSPYIPLLNMHRDDLRLRPELLALLPYAEITEQSLLTLDDIPLNDQPGQNCLSPEQTRWILVDHNVLQGKLGSTYGKRVVGCVDHHQDEKEMCARDHGEPHVIETSASCQSLVINYLRDTWDAASSSSSDDQARSNTGETDTNSHGSGLGRAWDAHIAKLAMASILIDSDGMTDTSKVTNHDIKAMEYLELKARTSQGSDRVLFDPREFFDIIKKAKSDLSNMDIVEVLKKDYKQWEEYGSCIGVSVVVKPLEYLIEKTKDKEGFTEALKDFSSKHNLSVLTVMTAYVSSSGEFQRQLLVFSTDKTFDGFLNKFQDSCESELSLEPINLGFNEGNLRAYQQNRVQKSRKQVGPLLRATMKL